VGIFGKTTSLREEDQIGYLKVGGVMGKNGGKGGARKKEYEQPTPVENGPRLEQRGWKDLRRDTWEKENGERVGRKTRPEELCSKDIVRRLRRRRMLENLHLEVKK